MVRKLYALIILALLLSACTGPKAAVEPTQPPSLAVATATQAQVVIPPTSVPMTGAEATSTTIPPTEAPTAVPTEVPTEAPTDTPEPVGPQPLEEDFDTDTPEGWKYVYIAGTERGNRVFTEDSKLMFEMNTKETYAYAYYENQEYEDVIVSTNVENFGDNSNGMAIACRMNDKGWYELRISSDAKMNVYRYDQLKKDKRQNPYVQLIPQFILREINPGFKVNNITMACVGDEIRVYINEVEMVYDNKPIVDSTYRSGYVGVGAMSYTTSNYGVRVGFDAIVADVP